MSQLPGSNPGLPPRLSASSAPSRSDRVGQPDFPPALGPVLEHLRLLWRLEHALARRSKRMERELGLTGRQRLALCILGRFPGLPAGELAALLHLHPSTLSGILARLERGGWIRRRPDPRDGRRALFGLTEKGRALEGEDPLTIEADLVRVLESLPPAQVEGARAFLLALAAELERDPRS